MHCCRSRSHAAVRRRCHWLTASISCARASPWQPSVVVGSGQLDHKPARFALLPTLQLQFQFYLLFKCHIREYYNAIFMFEFKTVNSTAMGTVGSSGSLSMYIGATVNRCMYFYKIYVIFNTKFSVFYSFYVVNCHFIIQYYFFVNITIFALYKL